MPCIGTVSHDHHSIGARFAVSNHTHSETHCPNAQTHLRCGELDACCAVMFLGYTHSTPIPLVYPDPCQWLEGIGYLTVDQQPRHASACHPWPWPAPSLSVSL